MLWIKQGLTSDKSISNNAVKPLKEERPERYSILTDENMDTSKEMILNHNQRNNNKNLGFVAKKSVPFGTQ